MGIGVSVFIMAVGAILAFAVEKSVEGVDINTVGVVLMIVGAVGLVWSMIIFGPRTRRTSIVEDVDDGTAPRRRYYREQEV